MSVNRYSAIGVALRVYRVPANTQYVEASAYDGLERLLIAICNEPRIKELLNARIRERLEEIVDGGL